ncbi:MAG TPA: hypothetical protein VGL79_00255 [Solirubrobacteraceae bacterium]|jgi:hypothetical protein
MNLQALAERYDEIIGQREVPPLLPCGTYGLMVEKVDLGSDYVFLHMLAHTGGRTRIRLGFSGNARSVAFTHLAGFGISKEQMPASLADIEPMLVGLYVQAELGQYEGNEHTFQTMLPGTVVLEKS